MATVEVTFAALPAHVRTARLIALAVARRAGVDEDVLDEVRLAVGEACSRAVGVNQRKAPERPVAMRLSDGDGNFRVEVVDVGPLETDIGDSDLSALRTDAMLERGPDDGGTDALPDLLPPGFGLAVISGLVEQVQVHEEIDGTHVQMSWPATEPAPPAG
jgi:anti-sigma regulatory factor (Ser/Thr protein kinase)